MSFARGGVPVYVLAGGRSRRYGGDKARALVGDQPLLVMVARQFKEIASTIRVVARSPGSYNDLGFTTIADSIPGKGPMGGLLTALEDAAPSPWVFLAACDQVGIRTTWARALLDARRNDLRAVVYRSDRFHPLFAVYHLELMEELRRRIGRGNLKMQHLFAEIPARVLPVPEGWEELVNLNQPPDRPLVARGQSEVSTEAPTGRTGGETPG